MKNKAFIFLFIFAAYLIVGCGGGGSDSSYNPVSPQNSSNGNINQSLVGEWYEILYAGKTVYSNSKVKVEYLGLKSNGNFRLISFYETEYSTYVQTEEELELDISGTWSYSNGKLNLNTSDGETLSAFASIKNNQLNISDGTTPADVYEKRDQDYNDYYFSNVNPIFVGNWHFYSVDNKLVYSNNLGNTDSVTINNNGTYSKTDYYSTEYDNYIQIQDNIESNITGYWSYNNGKIFFVDPYEHSFFATNARLENNDLILGTTNSVVYKK